MDIKTEPSRQMVEPPKVEPQRELSTDTDGEAKQPVEDSPKPEAWPGASPDERDFSPETP